jgi:hypothetical protein
MAYNVKTAALHSLQQKRVEKIQIQTERHSHIILAFTNFYGFGRWFPPLPLCWRAAGFEPEFLHSAPAPTKICTLYVLGQFLK